MSRSALAVVLCLALAVALCAAADAPTWGYSESSTTLLGPSKWSQIAPACAGNTQSPIDINTNVRTVNPLYGALNISYSPDRTVDLANNGHTTVVSDLSNTMYLDDLIYVPGVLNGAYRLAQFHLHWGQVDTSGSEHTLNGRGSPAEMHLVHYNTKFSSFAAAVASGEPDALAVIGVFYAIGVKTPDPLSAIVAKLPLVEEPGTDVSIAGPLDLRQLLPNDLSYFTYSGSLTTPNCQQIVRWIVLEKAMPITRSDLATLRATALEVEVDLAKQATDFRPTQPLNNRIVYHYTALSSASEASMLAPLTALFVGLVCAVALLF